VRLAASCCSSDLEQFDGYSGTTQRQRASTHHADGEARWNAQWRDGPNGARRVGIGAGLASKQPCESSVVEWHPQQQQEQLILHGKHMCAVDRPCASCCAALLSPICVPSIPSAMECGGWKSKRVCRTAPSRMHLFSWEPHTGVRPRVFIHYPLYVRSHTCLFLLSWPRSCFLRFARKRIPSAFVGPKPRQGEAEAGVLGRTGEREWWL
jgi:hypothetical protein